MSASDETKSWLLSWDLYIQMHSPSQRLKVTGEGIDFTPPHGNNNHCKIRGRRCHSSSPSEEHHGSGLQIHQGRCKAGQPLFFNSPSHHFPSHSPCPLHPLQTSSHFPLWRFLPPKAPCRTVNEVPLWHVLSSRVCRMLVACQVSLKRWLNFWTCHLVFLPCYCMCTWTVFVLQPEDGIREGGLCMNFSH